MGQQPARTSICVRLRVHVRGHLPPPPTLPPSLRKCLLLHPATPYYPSTRGKFHTRGNIWSFTVGRHECCDPAGVAGSLCPLHSLLCPVPSLARGGVGWGKRVAATNARLQRSGCAPSRLFLVGARVVFAQCAVLSCDRLRRTFGLGLVHAWCLGLKKSLTKLQLSQFFAVIGQSINTHPEHGTQCVCVCVCYCVCVTVCVCVCVLLCVCVTVCVCVAPSSCCAPRAFFVCARPRWVRPSWLTVPQAAS